MLDYRKDSDGVVVVFYRSSDGRTADIADFWLRPMIDGFAMSREDALECQANFAELLVTSFNRHFYNQARNHPEFPESSGSLQALSQ